MYTPVFTRFAVEFEVKGHGKSDLRTYTYQPPMLSGREVVVRRFTQEFGVRSGGSNYKLTTARGWDHLGAQISVEILLDYDPSFKQPPGVGVGAKLYNQSRGALTEFGVLLFQDIRGQALYDDAEEPVGGVTGGTAITYSRCHHHLAEGANGFRGKAGYEVSANLSGLASGHQGAE